MNEEQDAVCAFSGDTETLRPSEVRFTREFIAPEFRDGIMISGAVEAIAEGNLPVEVFEPLKVFRRNDKWFTWYNQRLYLLRRLEVQGVVDYVIAKVVDEENGRGGKEFNTKCDGLQVKFRYEDILPHGPIVTPGVDQDEEEEVDLSQEVEDVVEDQDIPESNQETTRTISTQTLDTTEKEPAILGNAIQNFNHALNDIMEDANLLTFVAIIICLHVGIMWYFS